MLGLDPNLHEFISRCMQMIVEQEETSRFLWGETSECHDISNFSIKYHLGVLFVLNHHPVTVLNHFLVLLKFHLTNCSPARRNGNGRRQGNAFASLMWIELSHRGLRKVERSVSENSNHNKFEGCIYIYKI